MSPERGSADPSNFAAVGQRSDPAAMIAMLDRLKFLLRGPKDHLLERLPMEQARTALDVGCGAGGDVVEMAGRMPPGGEAAGVDVTEAMIGEARRRHSGYSPGVKFRLGDALGLPYPDDVFDVCRVETVLQHLPDASRAVREMVRVTRPGGLAGAGLPDLVRPGELECRLGDGATGDLAGDAAAQGRLTRRERRRIMSYPLVIRLMIAMALMPDASYAEVLRRLAGLLADIPFALKWHVPTEKVITSWRRPVPPRLIPAGLNT